jgi:succinyl-CoA synthetase beta subunit
MTFPTPLRFTGADSEVSGLIRSFVEMNKSKSAFPEFDAKGLLRRMGLPVPNGKLLGIGEGVPDGLNLKFPLVAKVSSLKITSKSNVGGVRTGIADLGALNSAIAELSRIPGAEGVLVEEMAPEGIEVIVGGVIDPQFGPIVMFGLGGVFVELFKDVAFGLAPLGPEEGLRLLQQTEGYRILEGYRGKPPADTEALIRVLVVVSHIIATGLVREIDLNPVAIYPEGSMILDAKMLLIS